MSNRLAAQAMPSTLLQGETPHLIDEWQVAPVLWDAVRFAVDQRGGMGHFILTGSATSPDALAGSQRLDARLAGDDHRRHQGERLHGVGHLQRLCQKVDESKVGSPSFRMVLTGTAFAYVRDDGTIVCPLGALKP